MHDIVLISESELRARKRVAAVLDRYARRMGSDTWITGITEEGLKVLYQTLRRTATRQTAVSCFQRTPYGLALLWSVGKSVQALSDGSVPVHRHALPPVPLPWVWSKACLLAQTAGLAHDLGKASKAFQHKLRHQSGQRIADPVRHEWLSVYLLQALVRRLQTHPDGSQAPLVQELWADMQRHVATQLENPAIGSIAGSVFDKPSWPSSVSTPKNPLKKSLASPLGPAGIVDAFSCLAWLVASHHRFPRTSSASTPGGDPLQESTPFSLETYFRFGTKPSPSDLAFVPEAAAHLEPIVKKLWAQLARLQSIEKEGLEQFRKAPLSPQQRADFWFSMAQLVRPWLVLADHEISSQHMDNPSPFPSQALAANTWRPTGALNQQLSWHLEHVGRMGAAVVRGIYQFDPPGLDDTIRESLCKDAPDGSPFHWQTRVGKALRVLSPRPTLVLNLAGTGTGKTRMNARILAELCEEEQALRFSTALNLRSLTLQTMDAYQQELQLGEAMAGVIGDNVAQKLHQQVDWSQEDIARHHPAEAEVDSDGNPPQTTWDVRLPRKTIQGPSWMQAVLSKPDHQKMAALVMAPVAVCTADFLIDAGDLTRQGNQSLALLRASKSDLILDEIDSYDTQSLTSILRLVSLAAFYDRNVVASSATLSSPCARALYQAWQHGRWMKANLEGHEAASRVVMCDHVTEVSRLELVAPTEQERNTIDAEAFEALYQTHTQTMLSLLRKTPGKRHVEFIPTYEQIQGRWAFSEETWLKQVQTTCERFHEHHCQELLGRQVSVGLVRVANIQQALIVAETLGAAEHPTRHWQVACYHANLPVIGRHWLEKHLDHLLKRKPDSHGKDPLLSNSTFKKMVAKTPPHKDVIFVVVATPVEEVGRDHDFDWAVIEPSSTQSMVQTAGRVRRHRPAGLSTPEGRPLPNIGLLEFPWQFLQTRFDAHRGQGQWPLSLPPPEPLFSKPGLDTSLNAERSSSFLQQLHKELAPNPSQPFGSLSLFFDLQHLLTVGIDAGLKFDLLDDGRARHLFSELDNQSLNRSLKTAGRFFSIAPPDRKAWSLDNAYRYYALRPHEPGTMDVRVELPAQQSLQQMDGHGVKVTIEPSFVSKGTSPQNTSYMRIIPTESLCPNAWLQLPGDQKLEELCKQHGLKPEEGLSIRLKVYPGRPGGMDLKGYRWHLSFGIGKA